MAEEIAFENCRISNLEGLVTLTLDRVILHTVQHHASTSTYMPISLKSKKLFVDVRTNGRILDLTRSRITVIFYASAIVRFDLGISLSLSLLSHRSQI